MAKPMRKVAVIGGGLTGLSAAYNLDKMAKEAGQPLGIDLYEADSRLGGKVQTFREQGFTMEGGPDSFLARKVNAIHLIEELGLADQIVGMNPAATKTYIVSRGRLHRIPGGAVLGVPTEWKPFAKTALLSPLGKLRAGLDLVLPKGDAKQDESLGGFLRRRLGDPLVDYIIEPLLSGIYAGDADALSVKSTFPQFLEMERKYGSVIRGSQAQKKAAGANPPVKAASTSTFLSLKNGLGSLIDTLANTLQQQGVVLHLSAKVTSIRKSPLSADDSADEGTAERTRYRIELGDGESREVDAVIVTTQAFAAAKLLQEAAPIEPLKNIPYVSVATVMLAFPKNQIGDLLDGTGFVVPRKEKRTITACTWVSSKWLHMAPEDKVLIRCYVGHGKDQRHLQWTDEEIVSRSRSDIREIMGLEAEPLFTKVIRWNDAMPQYLVGHLDRMKTLESYLKEQHPAITVTGAGYYGVGLPDCIGHGQKAAIKTLSLW